MAEKQLEFEFMKNYISKVTTLDYIGGQDEGLGGYCEPLIIEYFDGMEQYVLHRMWQSREFGEIINNYEKAVFSTELQLIDNWKFLKEHLGWIDNRFEWEKTDSVCGHDATPEEFYKTKRNDLRRGAA